jgi:uncharacterized membrane protein
VSLHWAEQSAEIAAPAEICFEAITDYESFPRWQAAVESIEVVDRNTDGLGRRVRVGVDAKLRRVRYTLDYSYERPNAVRWDFVEGEGIEDIEGEYTFEERDGLTLATYRVGLDPGIRVPGLVARSLSRGVMRRSVEELRREAEARAGR